MGDLKNSDYRQKTILIFGGTIEGRQVSDYLCERHVAHTVCVATEYGEEVLRPRRQNSAQMDYAQMEVDQGQMEVDQGQMEVHRGRMDEEQIREFLRNASYVLVVDATHPYAVEVSKNIREACQKERVPYIRYLRGDSAGTGMSGAVYVDSALEAAQYLETRQGGIFLTTGSKELHVFTETISDKGRLFARVLPTAEVIDSCRALGLEGKQICAMQGPFSAEMNTAMLRQTGCAFLVTKETGSSGGFPEKLEAAKACRATAIIVRRPHETGADWTEVKARMEAVICADAQAFPESNLVYSEASGPRNAEEEKNARIEAPQKERKASAPEDREAPEADYDKGGYPGTDEETGGSSRRISCIGIGMGTPETLTCEAVREISEAQVLFGAERMLDCAYSLFQEQGDVEEPAAYAGRAGVKGSDRSFCSVAGRAEEGETARDFFADGRETSRGYPVMIPEYNAGRIRDWLAEHPQYRRVAILMSGDVGFYSGARQVAEAFQGEDVRYFCGISSIAYFASRIPTPWQDAKLLSAHGKELAITNYVKKYPKIILLAGGARDVGALCLKLIIGHVGDIRVTVGSNLSYPEERIETGAPGDFLDYQPPIARNRGDGTDSAARNQSSDSADKSFGTVESGSQNRSSDVADGSFGETESAHQSHLSGGAGGLYVMMFENPHAGSVVTPGIPDGEFARWEEVPMTKEEIRALSLSKLRLRENSVVYDVGAGTGSVSVECAKLCTEGTVYAIERDLRTINLIEQNYWKFGLSNVIPVHASAPDGLLKLPAPTHAFIGGSSGNMPEIIETLLEKNPNVRVVINTVTLESIAEVMKLIKKRKITDADIVQVSVSKARSVGRYHLMNALNPVYIVSFGGEG